MVASATARPNRVWELAVSIAIVICRQRTADQSPQPRFGWPARGERLRISLRIGRGRLQLRHPVQTAVTREGLGKVQSRNAQRPAAFLRRVLCNARTLARRLRVISSSENQV